MSIIDKAKRLINDGEIQEAATDLLEDIVGAIQGDPFSVGKIIFTLSNSPLLFREKLFWSKMELFLNGVYLSEDDRAKLRAKLLEDGSSGENAKRLIECIDRAETTQKIQYLINATRCLLTGFIDRTLFFRICRVVISTADENLLFARDHILDDENMEYNYAIQGLLVSGLVTFSVIGGETTQYTFTPLAEDVDRFALSYEDIARYPNPVGGRRIPLPNTTIPTATDDDVQQAFESVFGDKHVPNVEVEIPIGHF